MIIYNKAFFLSIQSVYFQFIISETLATRGEKLELLINKTETLNNSVSIERFK